MTRSSSPCQALTKKGKRCQGAATAGGLCFFHANPNKASELGRIGGRSKRPTVPENAEPLPALDSMMAVRDTVNRLVTDVYAGNLHPKIAAGLAPLLQLQIRALNGVGIEQRLSKLERSVARKQNSKSNGGTYRPEIGDPTIAEPPAVSREPEHESRPSCLTGAEQVTEPSTENGYHNICLPAPEAESKLYTINAEQHRAGDSKDGPRIQDAAARALQAELDEKERGARGMVAKQSPEWTHRLQSG